jgi:ATP-dependent Clp protease ATP-binding subunit ClpA
MNAPSELVPLNVSVAHPSGAALSRGPAAAIELANYFVVDSAVTFELAGEEVRAIKTKLDFLDTQRKGITKPLDEAKAGVMNLYRGPVEALENAERILKGKMLTFQQAEQQRINAARLEQERLAQAQRDKLDAEARALEAEGRGGEAEVKRVVSSMIVAPPVQTAPAPTAKGISVRTTIDHEVVDIKAAIAHIAAHPDLSHLLMFDSTRLRAYVKGLGLDCKLPGVRVFNSSSVAARK